jgi:hypothetical protein
VITPAILWDVAINAALLAIAEQRCERGTPWDNACLASLAAVRSLLRGDSEVSGKTLPARVTELEAALLALADAHELTIAGEGYDPDHCDCPVLEQARAVLAAVTDPQSSQTTTEGM